MPDIPQAALDARQMYLDGVPTRRILQETGLGLDELYRWLDGGRARKGEPPPLPPIPRRNPAKRRSVPTSDRASLVARMWRTAELQVRDIEARLTLERKEAADRERDARALAVLVRTLRELAAFDHSTAAPPPRPAPTAPDDDDPIPADIDDFRRELARRIHAFVDERAGPGLPGDPAGGLDRASDP